MLSLSPPLSPSVVGSWEGNDGDITPALPLEDATSNSSPKGIVSEGGREGIEYTDCRKGMGERRLTAWESNISQSTA